MTASSGIAAQALRASGEVARRSVELDQIFLFLFGALGPFNVIARFAAITRGREAGFKRRLALQSTGIAAAALLLAATLGTQILRNWSVSTEALLLTGGIILSLDLLAMLFADRILYASLISSALLILGSVMVVLQVALGVAIVLYALRLLGIVPG